MGRGRALVGYTGFVGGNLIEQIAFDQLYNSKNIEQITDKNLELLVFSGAQAKKWWANENPSADWDGIDRAMRCLRRVKADRVVLISTIDVLPPAATGCDEDLAPQNSDLTPYGRHRLALEDFMRDHFAEVLIVRLPGLFGTGLKKNVIFDLLTANQLEKINPASTFQYLDLSRLWSMIERASTARLSLVHLFAEPLQTAAIIERFFPDVCVGASALPLACYDFRTKHHALFGGPPGYVAGCAAVLDQLGTFIENWQNARREGRQT